MKNSKDKLTHERLSLIRAVKTNYIDILIYNYYDSSQLEKLNKLKRK